MKPIVFVGDSHLAAIKLAHDAAPDSRIAFRPFGPGNIVRDNFFSIDDAKRRIIVRSPHFGNIVLPLHAAPDAVYAVSLPLNTSRILRDYDWRNYVPWNFVRNPWERPLSDEAVSRLIESDAGRAIAFAKALAGLATKVMVIEAPTFFEDAPYLAQFRLDVCVEIAQRYCNYVIGRLSEAQIDVVRQPTSTLSELGTTKMAYNHKKPKDVHHANVKFGRMMLRKTMRMADRKPENTALLAQPLSRIRRALSRAQSRFFSVSRLS
jgi:hypothetical protein